MKFSPTPETIWQRPAYMPFIQPPLTDEAIREAENHFSVTLPREFTDLLFVQNGGSIRYTHSLCEKICGIGPNYYSIYSFDLEDAQEYVDYSLEGVIPFDGDGHWCYCLDFRSDAKNPGVSYLDLECNDQETVADSFAEFLDLLTLEIEEEQLLVGVSGLENAKVLFESVFGKKCQTRINNIGVVNHSYSVNDHYFWITENKCAWGYFGDPPNFAFTGESLVFPELPADAIILHSRDAARLFCRERLQTAGIAVVDIAT